MPSFEDEKRANIRRMQDDENLRSLTRDWFLDTCRYKYSYNFSWLGRPVIQYPQDLLLMQEIIWSVRPAVIVETGIAHGGSLVFYSSMLELLGGAGEVVGIDIDIRAANRSAIEQHPMAKRITLIEGSSIEDAVFEQTREAVAGRKPVLVVLDSNHTHEHVLRELELYSSLVTPGSYLVVFDTVVEDMPKEEFFPDRPWGEGNNPKTAVRAFLAKNDRFEIDRLPQEKALVTVAPDGFLRCLK